MELAREAISTSANPQATLVGSIGPYATYLRDGSEYSGSYVNSDDFDPRTIVDYYAAQARPLINAGVEDLLFETIPSMAEVDCLEQVVERFPPGLRIWISITCKVQYTPTHRGHPSAANGA